MKIMGGKGKEYSAVSREVENMFYQWLSSIGVEERIFDDKMRDTSKGYQLDKRSGQESVSLVLDRVIIWPPFVWNEKSGIQREDFYVDMCILLMYISSRYKENDFIEKTKKLCRCLLSGQFPVQKNF